MTAYTGVLRCPRCSLEVGEDDGFAGCPRCAGDGVPVNVHPVYDLAAVQWPPQEGGRGLFRWRDLLPLPTDAAPVSLGEGATPLVEIPGTAARVGAERLWCKDESRNPTWSYKDRLAAVAVTRAAASGAEAVVVATTGNHGAAAAAFAAAAGIRCVVLTLASVPETMKVLMQGYGAEVAALRTGPERWALMRRLVAERGWVPLSGFVDPPVGSNPFGVDGYKTIAYEVFTALGRVPDWVVVPTAYGDGLAGIARGFADLVALGATDRSPRMVVAEPLGPYRASLDSDAEVPARVEGRPSVAFSIASPVATYQGVAALRGTGGTAVVVADDNEILQAQLDLAAADGLYQEASSAISVPAVQRLLETGEADPGDLIVIIGTSTGLKDVAATASRLPVVEVIDPDPAALDRALAGT